MFLAETIDYVTPTHLWTLAEGTLAIITASLPSLKPLIMGPSKTRVRKESSYHEFSFKTPWKTIWIKDSKNRTTGSQPKDMGQKGPESISLPDFATSAAV